MKTDNYKFTPHELRIGSLVHSNNLDKQVVIDWINLKYITEFPALFSKSYSPIPLTEEWLKKLGFVYQGSDGYYCEGKSTLLFYFSLRNGLMPTLFYRRVIELDNMKGCLYVHQLQGLFYELTREMLTLKDR